jgi:hypothetical protein
LAREEKELVAAFANAGVWLTGVIHVPAELVAGVKIRLRPEAEAVVGECAASLPENPGVNDAPDELEDCLIRLVRPHGEQSCTVEGGTNDDALAIRH